MNPIYKDILYVFNEDVLRTALNEKGYFNTKLPSQIDQINNGNLLSNYLPLTSQLTTPNIVKSTTFTGIYQSELTIEEIFSKYYGMTNRLQIRRATKISDTDMRVQTEIYSNDIFKVTG
ncbi:hypothetical protein J6T66_03570 [bacterium]|nr:hypothetical protein [bacterium]